MTYRNISTSDSHDLQKDQNQALATLNTDSNMV